ncbi:MAG: hypothetical protein LBM93_07135 [Oscillospiraceae bacterium]|jgi:hypothetical protein|nr:hypothetical protein [Oscillospiraceae bacterium]
MLFKRISALGVVLVLLFLAGCQKENTKTADSPETTMPISYHTLPVPEDGWNGEEAIKTFYLFGHQFSENFTIESLGEEYTINKKESTILDSGVCFIYLNHNKDFLNYFVLEYRNIKSFDEVYDKNPRGVTINIDDIPELFNSNKIIFNGIKLGASKEEVETAFGTPTSGDNRTICYSDKAKPDRNCLGFYFDESGKFYAFSIIIN